MLDDLTLTKNHFFLLDRKMEIFLIRYMHHNRTYI